jgi:hypothetical protein
MNFGYWHKYDDICSKIDLLELSRAENLRSNILRAELSQEGSTLKNDRAWAEMIELSQASQAQEDWPESCSSQSSWGKQNFN